MRRADGVYPGWEFAENVGYSTPEHRAKIAELGISDLHRRSFQSIAYTELEFEFGNGSSESRTEMLPGDQLPGPVELDPHDVEPKRTEAG
jgi:hypothetical protein